MLFKKLDLFSLRLRLTFGVAILSMLGLGSLATWTAWKMQQIMIDNHKRNVEQISSRLPHDIKIYMEMSLQETVLQKVINNLTTHNTFLLFRSPNNQILAQSTTWDLLPNSTATNLMNFSNQANKAQIYELNGRYFVLCGKTLEVKGQLLGNISIAQDITEEQQMFAQMMRDLSIISFAVITIMAFAIAYYIKHSLIPLRHLSQMTSIISPQDLGEAQVSIKNAPSEVKELAQTFNMMLSRLSQAWEQERQFVSNVSHELRTPLTIVRGYLESVLRRKNNLTELQIEALETATEEAERTISLLQDLLELARADNGNLHLHIESNILDNLILEVVEMAQKFNDKNSRTIMFHPANKPIIAKFDVNRLRQVLLNLIDNASKYSEPNTTIVVKLKQEGEKAIIQVCDRGYGISLQNQSRIFERFYRIDEARNRTSGGSGLGLSIVKTLVEAMGGSITVSSQLEQGSVFIVSLPIN
ncbi:two-component sensor histidine kinase [Calothrix sp. NIES-4101]|nr:two-component sensor histidine kinase [Calothrix sp. NIES-4101]